MEIEEIIKHLEVLLDCTKELNNYYLNTADDWSKEIENGKLAIKAVKELQTTTQPLRGNYR